MCKGEVASWEAGVADAAVVDALKVSPPNASARPPNASCFGAAALLMLPNDG